MKVKWWVFVISDIFLPTLASQKNISLVAVYAINAIIHEHFTSLKAHHPGYIDIVSFRDNKEQYEKFWKLKVKAQQLRFRYNYKSTTNKNLDCVFNLFKSSIVSFESIDWFKRTSNATFGLCTGLAKFGYSWSFSWWNWNRPRQLFG